MVRTQTLGLIVIAVAVTISTGGAFANQSEVPAQQSKPIDRGFGTHDACFGDKYESDDDLKTGNEISIEEVLKLLNTPGT